MGRPTKQGIDYFPYDVNLDQDDKLQMIIAEFGYKGETIYVKLLSWIYKHNGYFVEWTEMEQLKFANRVAYAIGDSQVNLIKSVVARCIKWELFDERLFNVFHILTSKRIQSTWLEASRKRINRDIDPDIWLLGVNGTKNTEGTEYSPPVTDKVNKSKVNKKKDDEAPPATPPEITVVGIHSLLKSIDVLKDECLKDEVNFVDHACRQLKTTREKIPGALEQFNGHLKAQTVHAKAVPDYRKHFLSWAKKNPDCLKSNSGAPIPATNLLNNLGL